MAIPFVTSYASPEAVLGAMSLPYIPHHDSSWKESTEDCNLITRYGIKLKFKLVEGTGDYLMTIDVSAAKVPEGYPFTIEEVVRSLKACALKTFPASEDSKLRFTEATETKK